MEWDATGQDLAVHIERCPLHGQPFVTDVEFRAEPGEIVFVRGPNGVGKSLLLKSIANLIPFQGRVTLGARSSGDLSSPDWRAEVCYVGRPPSTFDHKTASELVFGIKSYKSQQKRDNLRATQPDSTPTDLPTLVHAFGLEQNVLNQEWPTLSEGQKQKVTLSISLSLCPPVLLLDEVTSNLDAESTLRAEAIIRQVAEKGAIVLWVSHDLEQVTRVGGAHRKQGRSASQLQLPQGDKSPISVLDGGGSSALHPSSQPDASLLDRLRSNGTDAVPPLLTQQLSSPAAAPSL